MAVEPAINLVTGEGCDELREAIERAMQTPGQPVTTGEIAVTFYGESKTDIRFTGNPDHAWVNWADA